jgi:hypothetical protein
MESFALSNLSSCDASFPYTQALCMKEKKSDPCDFGKAIDASILYGIGAEIDESLVSIARNQ